ncbi:MAG: hypothetical protein P4L69_12355 [Desulfosporosinus sp.]|nr:hypothetical protein [Desulfosporosinus sp.]
MCDTALGHTTQSKLTVQAPGFGERGARQSAILGALAAVHIRWPWMAEVPVAKDGEKGPCALPRVWGRSLERKFAGLLT